MHTDVDSKINRNVNHVEVSLPCIQIYIRIYKTTLKH